MPALLTIREISQSEASIFFEEHSESATAFSKPSFLTAVAIAFERDFVCLGIFEGSGLGGVAFLLVKRRGPLGIVQRVPIRYIGLLASDSSAIPAYLRELRKALARFSVRVGVVHLGFPPCSVTKDISESLHKLDIATDVDETFVLPLGDLVNEGLPETASRRVREKLRQAVRAGVLIRDAAEADLRDAMPRLLESTYRRRGEATPYPRRLPLLLWQRHSGERELQARVAYVMQEGQEVVVGMLVGLIHRSRCYSLWYVKDYENQDARKLAIEELLIRDMAARSRALGCCEYDLGGGPAGIREFKRRLGAEARTYLQVKVEHPYYRLFFRAYDAGKRYYRTPMRLYKRLVAFVLPFAKGQAAIAVGAVMLNDWLK